MHSARILIVDDEADICILLAEALEDQKWIVEWQTDPHKVLEVIRRNPYDLIFLDIKMPDITGLELLPRIKKISPETAIIMMSAYGNISMAVQAMKAGAEDYLEKPFRDIDEVNLAAQRLIEVARVRLENRFLKKQLEERFQLDGLISASPAMQEVFSLVKKIAPIDATVLITGETGTGKELIAKTLQRNSKRSNGPFISVNSGGLPEGLLESLLFGHEKGAFTGATHRVKGYFEEAHEGTLFLDEVGDMPQPLQVKLLRVLQNRSFQRVGGDEEVSCNIRLIAATNKDLEIEVEGGRFRKDLYFRLNVITLSLPPLRERREDIPILARYFLKKYADAFAKDIKEITPEAIRQLCAHDWPGNVRELENRVERTVALTEKQALGPNDFVDTSTFKGHDWVSEIMDLPIHVAKKQFEKRYLLEILSRHDGCVTDAARSAGLPRQNYHRKMKQLGISPANLVEELVSG
ncbi:MAG: sigma-54 dependent transcriptional regulator [bacterium]